MNKYKPYYSFSEDYEEIEVKVTAKRIGNNYIFDLPYGWVIDEDKRLITVCGMNPPERQD